MKRILLFLGTNIAVLAVLSIVIRILELTSFSPNRESTILIC